MIVDIQQKNKKNRRFLKKILSALIILCILAILGIVYLDRRLGPLLKSVSVTSAKAIATRAINEAVNEKMRSLNAGYDDIVQLEKDEAGNITALKTNSILINDIETSISVAVLDRLLEIENTTLDIPIGNIINGELFLGRGPKIKIKMSTVGSVEADTDNVFLSAGINQTRHQMVMRLTAIVGIILPRTTEYAEVTASVVIAETVLLGTVPFFNMEGG